MMTRGETSKKNAGRVELDNQITSCTTPVLDSFLDTKVVRKRRHDVAGEGPENDARMASCPSFETCDAPRCPLDALSDLRVVRPGDSRCRARKATRLRLGVDLPRKGLTAREWVSTIQFYGSWEDYAKSGLERKCGGLDGSP